MFVWCSSASEPNDSPADSPAELTRPLDDDHEQCHGWPMTYEEVMAQGSPENPRQRHETQDDEDTSFPIATMWANSKFNDDIKEISGIRRRSSEDIAAEISLIRQKIADTKRRINSAPESFAHSEPRAPPQDETDKCYARVSLDDDPLDDDDMEAPVVLESSWILSAISCSAAPAGHRFVSWRDYFSV